ncbi:hypothetical protein [Paenibacillus sp. DMB5]|uniref:hypothetical protein n=1 Tax=Paenibacillus sp. DMB5 TaxID=1780103 RepID=UPI00076D892C|nr:hypothetical protein [Paenibacillus sp. DMB5]KUP23126.1 hypothetical protein AWJ19_22890 [Paenibacillus sp. DMB5]
MNELEYTAAQRRRELEQKHFPQGMKPGMIALLDEVEQLLIKAYHAGQQESEQLSVQGWSNQSAAGYAIMAAEGAGFTERQIQALVNRLHNRFDMITLEKAADHYCRSAY